VSAQAVNYTIRSQSGTSRGSGMAQAANVEEWIPADSGTFCGSVDDPTNDEE